MRTVIAIDSFKGSMTSLEAGNAAAEGIKKGFGEMETVIRPLADGGEGTVEALVDGRNGDRVSVSVTGPVGKQVIVVYGILRETGTAVMEMAASSGLGLVPDEERNPEKTTTYGLGEMIASAVKKGCRRFLIGIGGSATNDGGAGMLQALGFRLLDKTGSNIPFGAEGLAALQHIDTGKKLKELDECTFLIASDVRNPLCGENGCSAVFGPQKGADAEMAEQMDQWMRHYAEVVRKEIPEADDTLPGSGAAGGLGFAFRTFLHADLQSGIDLIMQETGLEEEIRKADLVVTGEGRLDGQTVMGKTPAGVAALAKKYGKPVIAFSGCLGDEVEACNTCGIDAYFPILRKAVSTEEAMRTETAKNNLRDTAEQVFRLLHTAYCSHR